MNLKTIKRHAPTLIIFLWGLVISLSPRGCFGEDIKSDLKEILAIYDTEFLSSFKLQLEATYPTSMKSTQGRSTAVVTYYGGIKGQYMMLEQVARDPIKYDPDGVNNYDGQKNFLQRVGTQITVALEPSDWRIRHDGETIAVNTTNILAFSKDQVPILERYPVGHPDAANQYYRYLLGLGRGYSQLIDEITSYTVSGQGVITVKANGKLFSPYGGEWTLDIDTKADYLMQKATFIRQGQKSPTFTAKCSGNSGGDIPLHAAGTVSISKYVIDVKLLSYGGAPDEDFAQKAHNRIGYDTPGTDATAQAAYMKLFPGGTTVMDFTSVDSDGMPRMLKQSH